MPRISIDARKLSFTTFSASSRGRDAPDDLDVGLGVKTDEDDLAAGRSFICQNGYVGLMRDEHDRPVEALVAMPGHEGGGAVRSGRRFAKQRIEEGKRRHLAEAEQACRVEATAPPAGVDGRRF